MAEHDDLAERRAREVWVFDGHPGYVQAITHAGAVAAPLLAGFSFTLLALLLPTLDDPKNPPPDKADQAPFSACPELAGLLFLLAGLLLVAAVQAAIFIRYHAVRPSQLEEWYPEYFPPGERDAEPKGSDQPPEWSTDDWQARLVGGKWYGGWVRKYVYEATARATTWADWARWLYHGGILALLTGVAFLVAPPGGSWSLGRTVLFSLAVAGVAVEAYWIKWAGKDQAQRS